MGKNTQAIYCDIFQYKFEAIEPTIHFIKEYL